MRHHLYPFTTASAQGPPAPSADLRKHAVNSLGRTTNRSINSAAQNAACDALGRVTALTNALGGFTNKVTGSAHGSRLRGLARLSERVFGKAAEAPREGTRPTGNTAILAPL